MFTSAPPARPRTKRPVARLGLLLAVAVILIAGGVWGVLWWQDRALREAEAALKRGDARTALRLVNAYLKDNRDNGSAWEIKGRALVEAKQFGDARRIFEQYGAHDDDSLHAWVKCLLQAGELSAALPTLEMLLTRHPRDPDVLHEITACRTYLGKTDQAIASATTLSTVPGFEARGFVLLGSIQRNRGNDREAIRAFQKVLEHDPEAKGLQVSADELFLTYGTLLLDAGKVEEARTFLERSLKTHPSAEAHEKLGQALRRLGDSAGAKSHWKQAVKLGVRQRGARQSLAELELGRKKLPEARAWLAPLLEHGEAPTSSTAYLLQQIAQQEGNRDEAQRWREQAQRLRKQERLQAAAAQVQVDSPESFWARVVRARQFAEDRNWTQAAMLTEELLRASPKEPYLVKLSEAIRTRGRLPPLDELPITDR